MRRQHRVPHVARRAAPRRGGGDRQTTASDASLPAGRPRGRRDEGLARGGGGSRQRIPWCRPPCTRTRVAAPVLRRFPCVCRAVCVRMCSCACGAVACVCVFTRHKDTHAGHLSLSLSLSLTHTLLRRGSSDASVKRSTSSSKGTKSCNWTGLHTRTHTHTHTHTHTGAKFVNWTGLQEVRACARAEFCVCVYVYTHTNLHTHTHIIYIHTHKHIIIYMYNHVSYIEIMYIFTLAHGVPGTASASRGQTHLAWGSHVPLSRAPCAPCAGV